MNPIPILMYHFINYNVNDIVTIRPDDLFKQVKYLIEHKFYILSMDECIEYIKENKNPPKKSIVLTFDDGRLDFWVYTYPILKRYNLPATVFVITGRCPTDHIVRYNLEDVFIGKISEFELPTIRSHKEIKMDEKDTTCPIYDYLSWEEIDIMERSGLIKSESHTMFHKKLASEGTNSEKDISSEEVYTELSWSKLEIEKRLGKICNYIAWPKGIFDDTTIEIARRCGYKAALSTEYGVNNAGDDLMKIKRIPVKNGNLSWFARRLHIFTNNTLSSCYLAVNKKRK